MAVAKKDQNHETTAQTPELSYNEMVMRIEAITDSLRDPSADIDYMIENVEEAVRLIKLCKDKLSRTGLHVSDALDELSRMDASEKS